MPPTKATSASALEFHRPPSSQSCVPASALGLVLADEAQASSSGHRRRARQSVAARQRGDEVTAVTDDEHAALRSKGLELDELLQAFTARAGRAAKEPAAASANRSPASVSENVEPTTVPSSDARTAASIQAEISVRSARACSFHARKPTKGTLPTSSYTHVAVHPVLQGSVVTEPPTSSR